MQKTISKSNKDRRPTSYTLNQNKERIRTRSGYPISWKQVVEIEEVGRNNKGKKIHVSKTRHIPA